MVILRKKADKPPEPEKPEYLYQKKPRYFAQVADTLKDLAVTELTELGAKEPAPSFRGIYFTADKAALYRVNYCSRLISRVLAPVISFNCPDTDTIYNRVKRIQWEHFFSEDNTFAVFANVSDSRVDHSKFASLRVKDAIVDYFLGHAGQRPNVAPMNPDVEINLHILKNRADLSIDTSNGSLHRRGYREASVSAPMQETVAAAVIRMSGWNGSMPLYDPMCGSGTMLCEALMHYCRIPAGIFRKNFGFEHLPDFDPAIWQRVKENADRRIRGIAEGLISGSDRAKEAVNATKTNLLGLHHGNQVRISQADFMDLPPQENKIIVTNPPYGIRMGADEDMGALYKNLGDFLKQKCKGSTAYIYFGDRRYLKYIGLKPEWKKPLNSGGLEGRLVKYRMY